VTGALALGTSWHFFDQGGRLLTGADPDGLYAAHPTLQFGPLALLVAAPFSALGPHLGRWLACAAMAPVGLVILALLRSPQGRPSARLLVVGGVPFLLAWSQLAVGAGHLDDVLALVLAVAALPQLSRRPLLVDRACAGRLAAVPAR